MFVGRHCYSNTKRVYTQKTNKEEKKTFSGEEDEKTDIELLKSAAFLRWVGFSGLQDESRQLVLLRARPKIISLLWFTLALGLIPASASIWLLRLWCRVKSAPDASASPLAVPPCHCPRVSVGRTETLCLSAASADRTVPALFFSELPPPLRML